MSKSKRALIQIALSLVLAIVAGVLIFKWSSNVTQTASVTQVTETVPVVVTKVDLGRGVKLKEDMLEVRKYTVDSRPSGAFSDPKQLMGRVLNQGVGANEAITDMRLADESIMGGGVSALIEPGMRAMAVRGNSVMGLSGFVRPGDRVDVIVSLSAGRGGKPETKVVLEKIRVLATGKQLSAPDEEGKTASVDVYTLELTPEQSEKLALVSTRGTLHFALRNEQDDEHITTTGATIRKALASLRPVSRPSGTQRKARAKVEVITGVSRSSVRF